MAKKSKAKAAEALTRLIESYLSGQIDRETFAATYNAALSKYEDALGQGAYHPLGVIVPSDQNSERAWKLQFIDQYRAEIANLEAMLEAPEQSYSEKLTEAQLRERCSDAVFAIKRQVADLSAKEWMEINIVEDVEFNFCRKNGQSKLGHHQTLYRTQIHRQSFILSALENSMQPSSVSVYALLSALKERSEAGSPVWAMCTSPDNAIANVDVGNYSEDPYGEFHRFCWLEQTSEQSVQGGVLDLVLLSADRSWLLRCCNTFDEFFIELHGEKGFVEKVANCAKRA